MNYTPLSKKLLDALPKLLPAPKKKQEKYPNLNAGNPGNSGNVEKYEERFVDEVYKYIEDRRSKKEFIGLEEFAYQIGVDDNTILAWANRKIDRAKPVTFSNLAHPKFFTAIKKLKMMQKFQIMKDGFYGGKKVNAGMGVFLLKANFNMRDNEDSRDTEKDGNTFNFNMVNYG